MRGAGDRIFRYGNAGGEKAADKIVFPLTARRHAHLMLARRHRRKVRGESLDLLAIFQNDDPGAPFPGFSVAANPERREHIRRGRLFMGWACREVQRHPVPLPGDRQAARGGIKVDPRVRVIQLGKQNVRRRQRSVTAEIDFAKRGKPA